LGDELRDLQVMINEGDWKIRRIALTEVGTSVDALALFTYLRLIGDIREVGLTLRETPTSSPRVFL